MSQAEILNFLVRKRLSGDESFFTAKDIVKATKSTGRNIYSHINKIAWWGGVDVSLGRPIKLRATESYAQKWKKFHED